MLRLNKVVEKNVNATTVTASERSDLAKRERVKRA
jgi:hypothetical protein